MQLSNYERDARDHPSTGHFGPFLLQQVAVLRHQLAEVDAISRAAAVPVGQRAPSSCSRSLGCQAKLRALGRVGGPPPCSRLVVRPSCVHLTESTGPSSSSRLAARPSCVHLAESTGPSLSFRLAARPGCVYLAESTGPYSSSCLAGSRPALTDLTDSVYLLYGRSFCFS